MRRSLRLVVVVALGVVMMEYLPKWRRKLEKYKEQIFFQGYEHGLTSKLTLGRPSDLKLLDDIHHLLDVYDDPLLVQILLLRRDDLVSSMKGGGT